MIKNASIMKFDSILIYFDLHGVFMAGDEKGGGGVGGRGWGAGVGGGVKAAPPPIGQQQHCLTRLCTEFSSAQNWNNADGCSCINY